MKKYRPKCKSQGILFSKFKKFASCIKLTRLVNIVRDLVKVKTSGKSETEHIVEEVAKISAAISKEKAILGGVNASYHGHVGVNCSIHTLFDNLLTIPELTVIWNEADFQLIFNTASVSVPKRKDPIVNLRSDKENNDLSYNHQDVDLLQSFILRESLAILRAAETAEKNHKHDQQHVCDNGENNGDHWYKLERYNSDRPRTNGVFCNCQYSNDSCNQLILNNSLVEEFITLSAIQLGIDGIGSLCHVHKKFGKPLNIRPFYHQHEPLLEKIYNIRPFIYLTGLELQLLCFAVLDDDCVIQIKESCNFSGPL